jgi:hypothetical protein
LKYHAPSTVSPYITAPTSLSSLSTSACRRRARVGEHDLLGAVAAAEVARGEEVDAGDLELGREQRARVAADAEVREVVGAHLGHLEERRHQPYAVPRWLTHSPTA